MIVKGRPGRPNQVVVFLCGRSQLAPKGAIYSLSLSHSRGHSRRNTEETRPCRRPAGPEVAATQWPEVGRP